MFKTRVFIFESDLDAKAGEVDRWLNGLSEDLFNKEITQNGFVFNELEVVGYTFSNGSDTSDGYEEGEDSGMGYTSKLIVTVKLS